MSWREWGVLALCPRMLHKVRAGTSRQEPAVRAGYPIIPIRPQRHPTNTSLRYKHGSPAPKSLPCTPLGGTRGSLLAECPRTAASTAPCTVTSTGDTTRCHRCCGALNAHSGAGAVRGGAGAIRGGAGVICGSQSCPWTDRKPAPGYLAGGSGSAFSQAPCAMLPQRSTAPSKTFASSCTTPCRPEPCVFINNKA